MRCACWRSNGWSAWRSSVPMSAAPSGTAPRRGCRTSISSCSATTPKSAEIALIDHHVDYEPRMVTGFHGEQVEALSVHAASRALGEEIGVHLLVYDLDDLRGALEARHPGPRAARQPGGAAAADGARKGQRMTSTLDAPTAGSMGAWRAVAAAAGVGGAGGRQRARRRRRRAAGRGFLGPALRAARGRRGGLRAVFAASRCCSISGPPGARPASRRCR